MEENPIADIALDNDTDFDSQMADQLASLNGGIKMAETVSPAEIKPVDVTKVTDSTEGASSQAPANEAKAEGSSEAEPTVEYDFKEPIRGNGESDAIYALRKEIAHKIKLRETTQATDQKESVSDEIRALRQEMRQVGNAEQFKSQPFNNQNGTSPDAPNTDNISDQTRQILHEELLKMDVTQTLNTFIEKNTELTDPNTREVFFDFVESNFNWQGKTGAELNQVLEIASQVMFKKTVSLQERVLKSANVQEKVNAMQFPGGTVARQGISAEKEQSINELKSQGFSEEQALQLISD